MDRLQAQFLLMAANHFDGSEPARLMECYSGRGMNGKETHAIDSDVGMSTLMGYGIQMLIEHDSDEIANLLMIDLAPGEFKDTYGNDHDILWRTFRELDFSEGFRTDSLGRGTVIY